MIPATLIQSVPQETTLMQDHLWDLACDLHPHWEHISYRDPIDTRGFPQTSKYWGLCQNGAQLAGLVRLEALWNHGGIWLDSDMQLCRRLDPLRRCSAFAGWEEPNVVPDAVLGAEPEHPAIETCLKLAIERVAAGGNAWRSGPAVTTMVLPDREDVVLFGPDAFYPVFYEPRDTLEARLADHRPAPWTFGVHRWDWSWR